MRAIYSRQCTFGRLAMMMLVLAAAPLFAHRVGEGYIFLICNENSLEGRVEMTLKDLSLALDLDDDRDGEVSNAELEAHYPEVEAYVLDRIALGSGGSNYPLRVMSYDVQTHSFGRFARFRFSAEGVTEIPDEVEAEYRALYDVLPDHRGLLVVERNVKTGVEDNEAIPSLLFTPDEPRQSVDLTQPLYAGGFRAFVRHGIWHIWIGVDHILFVLSLVMASVLRRTNKGWEATSRFMPALISLAKVVTLFTVAHSITLGLAALRIVDLPPRLVESVIALSVVLAAVNNIKSFFGDWTWTVVFVFGLFHGFGFASVLGYLTQSRGALVRTLLGFNVGVEIGQLAVIAVAFPLLYLASAKKVYTRLILPAGSAAIALIAAVWFVERAFEIG